MSESKGELIIYQTEDSLTKSMCGWNMKQFG